MRTHPTPSTPVNNRGVEFIADFKPKVGRETKRNDIVIFDRIGTTNKKATDNTFKKGAFFKAASDSLFTKLFRYRANSKDVQDIFKSVGMTKSDAESALQNVKAQSKNLGLSGLSAHAVEEEINKHRNIALPINTST
jgi:hypothetical protein